MGRRGLAPATREAYGRVARGYLVFLEGRGIAVLDGADGGSVLAFLESLLDRWARSSLFWVVSNFRPFLKFTGRADLVNALNLAGIKRFHAIVPVLGDGDEERVVRACASGVVSARDAAITLLALSTGLRACDIVALRMGDVDWRGHTIGIVQQKTGNPLTPPLPALLLGKLATYAGPIFNCQKAKRTGGQADACRTQKGSPMTDTPSTEIAANSTDQPTGTLEHLDPASLEIGDNVRDDAALSKEFIASIAENGVLIPITGVRDPENPALVRVRNGQRRTLVARQLGLPSVPVYVLASSAADASEETIERIVHQIVTNDQKQDLTDAQRARGIQQMIDAGLSVTRVAKKLSVAKDTIKAANTAAQSSTAMDALASGQLSLTEAAAITEFEDMPGALDRLMSVAGTRRFEHTVAQLREERASAQAQAEAAQRSRSCSKRRWSRSSTGCD